MLLVAWGRPVELGADPAGDRAGHIDAYAAKPVTTPDERFHRVITELLDEWARSHLQGFEAAPTLPVLVLLDGRVLIDPSNSQVAEALGVKTRAGGGHPARPRHRPHPRAAQIGLPARPARRDHRGMDEPSEIIDNGPVHLRRWRAGDAATIYRLVTESLEHLRPWMPWASGYDHERAVQFAAQSEQDWDAGVAYQYAITTDGTVVGSCGLMRRIGPGGLEIGYWLHRDWTGRGLATAAAEALQRQAFALPGIERVEIHHDEANVPSGAVPRRLGYTEVERRGAGQDPLAPREVGTRVIWRLTRSRATPA